MKKTLFNGLILSSSLMSCIYADNSNSKEHVVWNKTPITIEIATGSERIISFPDSVNVRNTDDSLTTDKVNILNNQGTLYIKAKKDFEPIRAAVELQKTGEVILVDISSRPDAANIPLEIILKDNTKDAPINGANTSTDYVGLMRAAIQELYVPQRLVEVHPEIKRTPMYTQSSVKLFWDVPVIAMPIASWTGNNFYVTAVMLKNTSKRNININLDYINGQWIAASFYPGDEISKAGSKKDRTTLFLVSSQPFQYAYQAYKEVL